MILRPSGSAIAVEGGEQALMPMRGVLRGIGTERTLGGMDRVVKEEEGSFREDRTLPNLRLEIAIDG